MSIERAVCCTWDRQTEREGQKRQKIKQERIKCEEKLPLNEPHLNIRWRLNGYRAAFDIKTNGWWLDQLSVIVKNRRRRRKKHRFAHWLVEILSPSWEEIIDRTVTISHAMNRKESIWSTRMIHWNNPYQLKLRRTVISGRCIVLSELEEENLRIPVWDRRMFTRSAERSRCLVNPTFFLFRSFNLLSMFRNNVVLLVIVLMELDMIVIFRYDSDHFVGMVAITYFQDDLNLTMRNRRPASHRSQSDGYWLVRRTYRIWAKHVHDRYPWH